MDVEEQPTEIDEGLYSRQLYVMGREGQARMAVSDVLIVGMNGLGVEIAKNVILAGVKSVTLHDPTPTSWLDLSAQFYLGEAELGQPRAAVSAPKLAELNQYVKVTCRDDELNPEFLSNFQCVVMINAPYETQLAVNDYCHANGKQFISSEVAGVFGSVFCDFGPEFVVSDINGEAASSCIVASITQASPALVTVLDDQRHGLETGAVVQLDGLDGMEELNGRQFTITFKDAYSFEIDCDTTAMSPYKTAGYVNEIKQPTTLAFKSLRESLTAPGEITLSDFGKWDRPGLLHMAFRALDVWKSKHGGAYPTPGNLEHAGELMGELTTLNEAAGEGEFKLEAEQLGSEATVKVVQQLSVGSAGVINPMCALLGGVVGQEVLKACSGKFMPLTQFFYFDATEALPDQPLTIDQVTPTGCRYDSQIVVFGSEMQEKIMALNYFLVGSGAIGCEMLKNWALMGLAAGESGHVHITDMDSIEKSNLSRQFLFRPSDIGKMKATAATAKAQEMNPAMKITVYEARVGSDSEGLFNDDFFEALDGVTNALDNIEARLYMDSRCLFYQKPLLESGTLGTKGNTQMVVPHLTENYGATRDPPEKSIPVCTLKNFPNQIEHTLQWSRDMFEGMFKQTMEDTNTYLTSPDFAETLRQQQSTKLDTLKNVKAALVDDRALSFDDCIAWTRLNFEVDYNNKIRQLLHNFPEDQVTSTGQPFWSGSKRAPVALVFDASDPLHLAYIKAGANLRASNYGIKGTWDDAYFLAFLPNVVVPGFTPKDGVKIKTPEEEKKEADAKAAGGGGGGAADEELMDVDAQCDEIIAQLPTPASLAGFQLNPVEFDKDIDEHMEFVTAASNLRARNYKIPEADMHRSRLIAGKIIPAIATTTALVTGLVCLELYKVIQSKPVEAYKNGFVNLAIPVFAFSEPQPPATTLAKIQKDGAPFEWKWSAWDRLDIKLGDITLKQLIAHMEDAYGLELTMLSHGVSILYSFFQNKKKTKARMPMTMSQLVTEVTGKEVPPEQKYLIFEVMCSTDEDDEVDVPCVRLFLNAE